MLLHSENKREYSKLNKKGTVQWKQLEPINSDFVIYELYIREWMWWRKCYQEPCRKYRAHFIFWYPFLCKYYINIIKSLVLIYIFSILSHPNIYQCKHINQNYKDRNKQHNQWVSFIFLAIWINNLEWD